MNLASITFKAGKEYEIRLARLGKAQDEIAKKAIYKGAGIIADRMKRNLKARLSEKATGDLVESMGIASIKMDQEGNLNTKIGFDGYDRKGVPNQLKARALESGTSRIEKRPFVRPAVQQTKKQVEQEMNQIIEEETKKIMK